MISVVEPTPPDAYLTHACQIGRQELFVLEAPEFDVTCQTSRLNDCLKLIAPRKGTVLLEQNSHSVHLGPGQVGLVSLEQSFRFQSSVSEGLGDIVQWRLPRDTITRRHPGWHCGPVRAIGDGSAGERVLAELLTVFANNCHNLSQLEAAAGFTTLVEALGLLKMSERPSVEQQRVSRAVSTIRQRLYDSTLAPEMVAASQGVTRRYLDDLLKRHGNASLTATIRNARLDEAALSISKRSDVKLLSLALSLGFENQSHFSRRFKERFGVIPSRYRAYRKAISSRG